MVNHHSTTAPPRHPHRNNDAILLPHPHRNNDAILLPRPHRNNDAILLPRHIATTPPSYSTPNIILHASNHTPHNIIKLATTPPPSPQTTTNGTVWTRLPREGCENGAVSRQGPLPRMQGRSGRESARHSGGNAPPCHVDEQEACPLSRLAERAKARPEGAWDEKRRQGLAERKACVWTRN